MSPREIWCNEAQEALLLAIRATDLARFRAICERERCPSPLSVRGDRRAAARRHRPAFRQPPVDMELDVLLGKPPKMTRNVARRAMSCRRSTSRASPCPKRVARAAVPRVADKTFPRHHRDRTVGGCARAIRCRAVAVPVADVAVTLMDFAATP